MSSRRRKSVLLPTRWKLTMTKAVIERHHDGWLTIHERGSSGVPCIPLSPAERRRLFQKLSGDYRD